MGNARLYWQLLRPHHWIKNVLLFAPVLFAKHVYGVPDCVRFVVVFLCLCALASALYIVNDWIDMQADRLVEEKRRRPLAAGKVPLSRALSLAGCLGVGALWGAWYFGSLAVARHFCSYAALILLYSLWWKRVVLVDVMVLAIGFLLRLAVGAELAHAPLTVWVLLTTFFLALFLSFAKRRHELSLLPEGAARHRATLAYYTVPLLDQAITALIAAVMICYSLFTVSPHAVAKFGSTALAFTIPVVVYGLLRYLMMVQHGDAKTDVVKVIGKDVPLLCCIGLWGLLVILIVYIRG